MVRVARAAVLPEYDAPLEVHEIQVDEPEAGEVLVRMAVSGVCGTDEHVVRGDLPLPVPMVMGHEGSGVVEDVGTGVSDLQVGDHVVLSWLPSCGTCVACRQGWVGMCRETASAAEHGTLWAGERRVHWNHGQLNVMSLTGTLSTYVVVPRSAIVRIPQDFPLSAAAILGCSATTGYGAVAHRAKVSHGATVTVIGVGGVGIHVIAFSRMFGASRIIAIDPSSTRLAQADQFGATDLIATTGSAALMQVLDLTEGFGTDYAFEVVGTTETIQQAFNAVRPGGTAVVIGVAPPHEEVCLNAFAFPSQGKTLTGTWYGSGNFAKDVRALVTAHQDGRIRLVDFVGDPYPLDDVNRAFSALRTGSPTRPLVTLESNGDGPEFARPSDRDHS